jgi:class 3 adenylate cyclase
MGSVDTDAWEGAGLYQPGSAGAEERLALLEYLTERGATLEQMVEADRLGALPSVAGDLVPTQSPATLSVEQLAARCGVPVETVQRVLLAAGLPLAPDTKLSQDLDALISTFVQGADLMGEDAILAFTRVLGAAAANIAEGAVALFYAELGPGTPREGFDEVARAQMSERATLAFANIPEVLRRVIMAQFDRATRRALITRGSSLPAGVWGAHEVAALGFVDLVGSTAWAAGLSLRDQSLALSRFESDAWSSAVLAGGRVIKMIGDEAFFTAPSADAACRVAIEVCRAAAQDPMLPPARAAVGQGLVTPREGDYFGPLVNVVSRLVKVAAPGDLVVTEEVASALPPDRWTVRDLGPTEVRGVEEPVRVFAVNESGGAESR